MQAQGQYDSGEGEDDGHGDGDPVQVLLDNGGARRRLADGAAEHVREPAALTGVHEDEEDQRQRGGQVKNDERKWSAPVVLLGPSGPLHATKRGALSNGGSCLTDDGGESWLRPTGPSDQESVDITLATSSTVVVGADRAPYWIRMAWADSSPANPATTARMWEQACWASAPVAVTPVPMAQMGS